MMNQRQLIATYGDPGSKADALDPRWRKANAVTRQGARAMPGVPPRFYFECHRLLEPRIEAGFAAAKVACPTYKIERAASLVFRHQRWDTVAKAAHEGRPLRDLSWHAYGAAVDVDPHRNRAIDFPDGTAPRPYSPRWLKTWPDGLPQAWVRAFCKAADFEWGGDWINFKDPQHFQPRS